MGLAQEACDRRLEPNNFKTLGFLLGFLFLLTIKAKSHKAKASSVPPTSLRELLNLRHGTSSILSPFVPPSFDDACSPNEDLFQRLLCGCVGKRR